MIEILHYEDTFIRLRVSFFVCLGWEKFWFDRALNAAACLKHYTPCSFNEVIRNNQTFTYDEKHL